MISDLLEMARSTLEICRSQDLPAVSIAVPLSSNRLLLNDHVIYPNTPCTMYNGSTKTSGCAFVSTIVKDRDQRERRRDLESGNVDAKIVIKVSATRKKRFPISALRTGQLRLQFEEQDIEAGQRMHEERGGSEEESAEKEEWSVCYKQNTCVAFGERLAEWDG